MFYQDLFFAPDIKEIFDFDEKLTSDFLEENLYWDIFTIYLKLSTIIPIRMKKNHKICYYRHKRK